ncbi:unnamed protein product [Linum tenue]|uniref:Uncharacterized protein n=1 Tax=Linum tenue TaxID=586396 RepID=A0AAV0PUI5_9ROSI|nr:unnamed protein product [Linum tenue]
MYNSVEWQ